MKLSHSKLSTILSDPISYYLSYIQGISLKETKPALAIGSAVHWGIEHNTEDLSEYFKESGNFKQATGYTKEQLLSEAMVHGYLKHKDEIFEKILTDKDGSKAELVEETHELYVTAKINSRVFADVIHDFVGIIDLLLLTDKGFVVIDYKTSTFEPDWNGYLDQIYRYIMLLKDAFPEVPIFKIGIINIRKSGIRQKRNESESEFLNRLKFEYDVNDENYVNYHEYLPEELDENLITNYIKNLKLMCDLAYEIENRHLFFINYGAQKNQYGKSQFYDIIYETENAELLYNISDVIWNDEINDFVYIRDCVKLDMDVIKYSNCMNKYLLFKHEIVENGLSDETIEQIKRNYRTDDELLNKYIETYKHEMGC